MITLAHRYQRFMPMNGVTSLTNVGESGALVTVLFIVLATPSSLKTFMMPDILLIWEGLHTVCTRTSFYIKGEICRGIANLTRSVLTVGFSSSLTPFSQQLSLLSWLNVPSCWPCRGTSSRFSVYQPGHRKGKGTRNNCGRRDSGNYIALGCALAYGLLHPRWRDAFLKSTAAALITTTCIADIILASRYGSVVGRLCKRFRGQRSFTRPGPWESFCVQYFTVLLIKVIAWPQSTCRSSSLPRVSRQWHQPCPCTLLSGLV